MALLGAIGCNSPNAEQRFIHDIADKQIVIQTYPLAPRVQDEQRVQGELDDVERRWNTEFSTLKPIHITVLRKVHRDTTDASTGSAAGNDPFASMRPRQADSNTIYLGSAMLNPLQYAQLIADITGMKVEIAPESRTIILY